MTPLSIWNGLDRCPESRVVLSVQDANPAKRDASLVEPIAFLGGAGVAPTLLRCTGQIAPAAFHNHCYGLSRLGGSPGFQRSSALTAIGLAPQHQDVVTGPSWTARKFHAAHNAVRGENPHGKGQVPGRLNRDRGRVEPRLPWSGIARLTGSRRIAGAEARKSRMETVWLPILPAIAPKKGGPPGLYSSLWVPSDTNGAPMYDRL
jgi:hypothetical protein